MALFCHWLHWQSLGGRGCATQCFTGPSQSPTGTPPVDTTQRWGMPPPPPCSTNALATEHFRSDHIFSGTQLIGCQSNWVLNGVSDGHSCSLDCSLDTGGGYNARGSALRMTWKRGGKRHIPPHPAQPRHTNDWAPRTRKRHQQEHRPQRPTERSDPTQRAKGRTGDCPGPP